MGLPLHLILDSIEDAILCVDDRDHVVFLNDAAATILRCKRADGMEPGPVLADVVRQLNPFSSTRAVQRLRLQNEGSDPLFMEAVISGVEINGERFRTAVLRDISQQQQMEKAVYESRKTQALGALASGIAHDFNNVLAAIISQIDLVLHAPECPAAVKDHLVYAQMSARRGAELVSKLQMFGRQGKMELAPVDMTEVVEQVVFMLRRSIDPKVTVEGSPAKEKPWTVRADLNQILQVLLNLGINARDAMPRGGRLTFSLSNSTFGDCEPPRRKGEFLRVSVTDTGSGMPPEVVSRIFEPYFSTKDLSRGPGLGLSIAAAVVADHSGWMEVESTVDKGTCFHVFLPRCSEPEVVPRRNLVVDSKAAEGKERILVVDDEELVRMVTRTVLAYRGYQVTEAEHGEDAVQKYASAPNSFDLVLMDLHMPRLNGYDALVQIRKINPKAKAIILSGGMHDPEEGMGQMANVAFLHKPYENQELVRVVRELLDED